MGMSGDLREAIESGSTMVRVGSAFSGRLMKLDDDGLPRMEEGATMISLK